MLYMNLSANSNVQQLIIHHQIGSSRPNHKLCSVFDVKKGSQRFHKIMIVDEIKVMDYLSLFEKRKDSYNRIKAVLRNSDASCFSDEAICLEKKWEYMVEGKATMIEIRQPYFSSNNLAHLLRQNSIEGKGRIKGFSSILFSLLNFLIRIEETSLLIPTFPNVLINQSTSQLKVNLFSFAGVELLRNQGWISSGQIKEVAAFLESNHFRVGRKSVNMPRAFAVLVLGMVIGKEIDLHHSVVFSQGLVEREKVEKMVQLNAIQFKKILGTAKVKRLLSETEREYNISLDRIMHLLLVREENLVWSQVIAQMFNAPMCSNFTIVVGSRQSGNEINLKQYLMDIGNATRMRLTAAQWSSLMECKIISTYPFVDIEQSELEMFLIWTLNIDLRIFQSYRGSLCAFLKGCQDKQESHFSLKTMQMKEKFERELFLRLKQRFEQQSQEDTGSAETSYSRQKSQDCFQQKNQMGPSQGQQFQSEFFFAQSEIQQLNYEPNYKVDEESRRLLIDGDPAEQPYSTQSERYLGYLQVWTEAQIHKFKLKGMERVGTVLSSRLQTLLDYSKILTNNG